METAIHSAGCTTLEILAAHSLIYIDGICISQKVALN